MAIPDLMTRNPVTVSPNDTVAKIRELFKTHKFHHLLVVENEVLIGIIVDRDILRILSPYLGTTAETEKDRVTLTIKASTIMKKKVVTIREDSSIINAGKALIQHNIELMPVINAEGKVSGVLSWKDIMKHIIR